MNRITLEKFLMTFNFRYMDDNENYNTETIRIYPDENNLMFYIEFGIYDWDSDADKLKAIKKYLSVNNLLNMYIGSISIEERLGNILCVYLTNEKNMI